MAMYSRARGQQRWIPAHPISVVDPSLFFYQGDGKEIPPELKMRLDPQQSLAQCNEGRDLLDPIRIEVLQLYLVVVEKPAEEGMRGHPESALVEVREGNDVAVPRRWQFLAAR
jgi:hypothetical protein